MGRALLVAGSVCWCLLGASASGADRSVPDYHGGRFNGQLGLVLGQHQLFELNSPAFHPLLELRTGYQVSRDFLVRIDIGAGLSEVTESEAPSFEGATLNNFLLGLVVDYTPALSDSLFLNLGVWVGYTFLTLYGENLLGITAGSRTDYLEQTTFGVGPEIGLEWNIAPRWALVVEGRYVFARGTIGGLTCDLGGLSATVGFLYRLVAWDIEGN